MGTLIRRRRKSLKIDESTLSATSEQRGRNRLRPAEGLFLLLTGTGSGRGVKEAGHGSAEADDAVIVPVVLTTTTKCPPPELQRSKRRSQVLFPNRRLRYRPDSSGTGLLDRKRPDMRRSRYRQRLRAQHPPAARILWLRELGPSNLPTPAIIALRGAPSDSILDFSNKPPTVGPGALFPGMKRQYINLLRWLLWLLS